MNFTSLRYFLAVAEEKNITHAAEKLFISQQALSGHIRKLEEELGIPLFDRSPVFSLTYAGRRLVEYAEQAIGIERQIYRMAADINDDRYGELRVGISHTCGRAILPSILPRFRQRYPNLDVVLKEENSAEMERGLKQGDLDLMVDFTPITIDGAEYEPLIRERLFLVVPKALLEKTYGEKAEEVARRCDEKPDLKLFRDFPFVLLRKGNRVRGMVDKYMGSVGFSPNVALETENIETAFALANRGMGITVYPELFLWCIPQPPKAERPVEFFPLRDPVTVGTLAIAHMKTHYVSKAAEHFIAACKEGIGEIRDRETI